MIYFQKNPAHLRLASFMCNKVYIHFIWIIRQIMMLLQSICTIIENFMTNLNIIFTNYFK